MPAGLRRVALAFGWAVFEAPLSCGRFEGRGSCYYRSQGFSCLSWFLSFAPWPRRSGKPWRFASASSEGAAVKRCSRKEPQSGGCAGSFGALFARFCGHCSLVYWCRALPPTTLSETKRQVGSQPGRSRELWTRRPQPISA